MMGAESVENQRIEQVEKWIFYFIGGFALFSSVSIAVGNIFLSLSILAGVYRLYLKHDDIASALLFHRGIALAFAGVMAAAVVSGLFSVDPVFSLRLFGDYYGYRMTGLFVVLITVRDKQRLCSLVKLGAVSCICNSLFCIWEGWNHVDRAGGFLSNVMATAGTLSLWIPLFLLAWLQFRGQRQTYALIGFVLSLAAAFFNETRGLWIAVAISLPMLAYLVMKNKKKFLAGCLVGLLLIGGSVLCAMNSNGRLESIKHYESNERTYIWAGACHMFRDYPILGIGFGQFEEAYQTKYILPEAKERSLGHAHSNVMQMFSERGLAGGLTFLWMWGYFSYWAIRGWKKDHNIAYMAFLAIVTGVMLQGLTEYNMGSSIVTKLYWFSLAICLQWIRLSREEMKS